VTGPDVAPYLFRDKHSGRTVPPSTSLGRFVYREVPARTRATSEGLRLLNAPVPVAAEDVMELFPAMGS
jgi:hypothetical protein